MLIREEDPPIAWVPHLLTARRPPWRTRAGEEGRVPLWIMFRTLLLPHVPPRAERMPHRWDLRREREVIEDGLHGVQGVSLTRESERMSRSANEPRFRRATAWSEQDQRRPLRDAGIETRVIYCMTRDLA